MRISINLASRPFADLGPALLRLRVAMGSLAVLALGLWLGLHLLHGRADKVRAQERTLDTSINKLNQERQGYRGLVAQPQNAAVIDQAGALNGLIDKKAFSWTLAIEDLETVLPGGVQVTTVEPNVDKKDGHVTVRLRVVGPRDKGVDLVANLEHSHRFLQPRIMGESAETSASGNPNQQLEPVSASNRENFELLADYNPATPAEGHRPTKKSPPRTRLRLLKSSQIPGQSVRAGHAARPPRRAAGKQDENPPGPAPTRVRHTALHPAEPSPGRTAMIAAATTWRERLASPLTWHYAGFAVLLVTVFALGTRFALDWNTISAHTHDSIMDRQIQLHALKVETEPLRGLDKRLDTTRDQIAELLLHAHPGRTIPPSPPRSAICLWPPASASPRSATAQRPPASNLSEIVIDAGITGEYPQIMKFINSVERDKIFFVITGMSLTGQQAGAVNLRLQMSTWLRPADAAASGLPHAPAPGENSTRRQRCNSEHRGPAAMKLGTEDKKKVYLIAGLLRGHRPARDLGTARLLL